MDSLVLDSGAAWSLSRDHTPLSKSHNDLKRFAHGLRQQLRDTVNQPPRGGKRRVCTFD